MQQCLGQGFVQRTAPACLSRVEKMVAWFRQQALVQNHQIFEILENVGEFPFQNSRLTAG